MPEPIPAGTPRLVPMLGVRDAAAAIDWYVDVLGGVEEDRLTMPDGKIGYAAVQLGDARIILADESPDWGNHAPPTLGGTPVRLYLYVEDVDAVFARALEAGATEEIAVSDQFYGDRSGRIQDPFGHLWVLATHVEDVSSEEMRRRMDAMFGDGE